MSTETIRLISDGEKEGSGYGGGGRAQDYIYIHHTPIAIQYTVSVTTRMTPAVRIRQAAMRAILNDLLNVMDKVTRQCLQTTFEEKEERRSRFKLRSLCLLA